MVIGSTTGSLRHLSIGDALAFCHSLGVRTVEFGAGGYIDTTHLQPERLVKSGNAVRELKELLEANDLTISALSCPGNPIHPDKELAAKHHRDFLNACHLAQALGVDTIVTFSGCPGDCASSKTPNFVTTSWPPDMAAMREWQWERVLVPYWKEAAAIAASYGIRRLAMEMMPGFCVYNPQTLWRLRDEIGRSIGATVDPAHLIRQGIDPAAAIRELKDAVYQVHMKDLVLDADVCAVQGIFEPVSADDPQPFAVRAIGAGHDAAYWMNVVRALRDIGYDRSLTIEHDDTAVSPENGIHMAAKCVKALLAR